jgi:hypothetical protein
MPTMFPAHAGAAKSMAIAADRCIGVREISVHDFYAAPHTILPFLDGIYKMIMYPEPCFV